MDTAVAGGHGNASAEPGWLERLVASGTPADIAAVLLRVARARAECAGASVLWWEAGEALPQRWHADGCMQQHAAEDHAAQKLASGYLAANVDDEALSRAAMRAAAPAWADDGLRVAVPIALPAPAVLLLTLRDVDDAPALLAALEQPLRLAAPLLTRARKWTELENTNARLSHSEQLQRALFAISDLAGSERDMPDLLRGIHAIVGTLMYAENFFIALHDAERDTIRFLYFADVEDTAPRDPAREIPLASREHTLTWYVIRDGLPLMGRTSELQQQVSGPLLVYGPDSHDWLGVPMLRDGQVHGALVPRDPARRCRADPSRRDAGDDGRGPRGRR